MSKQKPKQPAPWPVLVTKQGAYFLCRCLICRESFQHPTRAQLCPDCANPII